jgi:MFS family permease
LKEGITSQIKDTYRILTETKQIILPCFLLAFSQVIVLILATIVPGYATTILEVPTAALSIILFGPAACGMLVASLITGSAFTKVNKQKLITIGVFISGLVLCLFPFTTKIVTRNIALAINVFLPESISFSAVHFAMLLSFFAGFGNALIFIPSQTIIQERIPESFRSKVYGLLFGLIGLFSLLPVLISGGLADILGVSSVLLSVGSILLALSIIRMNITKNIFSNFK